MALMRVAAARALLTGVPEGQPASLAKSPHAPIGVVQLREVAVAHSPVPLMVKLADPVGSARANPHPR